MADSRWPVAKQAAGRKEQKGKKQLLASLCRGWQHGAGRKKTN
ncbi:MAG: hypothetical protein PHP23_09780 [Desulfobacterales bacterium]|nr:hypothetical protein [Desulfobacterales bacterium]MDD4072299.1 hypothetical protein [Desulfobacterales bacterium]